MKRKLLLLALAAVIGSAAYSASIDHIQTYTPEYLGNQAQNGMINGASVYYNPAGLARLQDGTYIHAGLELAVGHEKMKYNGKDYKADLLQPIPNFAAYKVEDGSALYMTFGGLGGGGDLKYKDGVAGTAVIPDLITTINKNIKDEFGFRLYPFDTLKDVNSSAEGKNLYIQTTVGKVWTVDEKLSVSLGGRVVYGIRELKGKIRLESDSKIPNLKNINADIDSKRTAWGYGVQLGLNYKATDRLNLALRYDSRVKMNFKAKGSMTDVGLSKLSPLYNDLGFGNFYPEYIPGAKVRRDLPAILALGASYKVTDNWTMALAGNYYFNKDAKMDSIVGEANLVKIPEVPGVKGIEAEYDNGWEVALGTEYRFNPKWAILGSVNYAYTGAKVTSFDDVEYALNSVTLGTGLKYNPNENAEWVFSVSHFIYDGKKGHFDKKYKGLVANPEYDKSITAFGVSYTQRF